MKYILRIIVFLITCQGFSQACQTIDLQLDSSSPSKNADGYIRVCVGETVTLSASAIFSDNDKGAVYEWDLDDGSTLVGASASFSYGTPGVYIVNLRVSGTTPARCTTSVNIDQVIQVSTEPNFSKTEIMDAVLCFGESTIIEGNAKGTEFDDDCTPPVGTTTALPDGVGVPYETSVFVDCFNEGETLSNIDQLESICLNMEHSFVGDLHIDIVSPSGQTVRILSSQGGITANFGHPWADGHRGDNTGNLTPGVGSEYCIIPDSSLPTLKQGIVSGGSFTLGNGPGTYIDDYVPTGDYRSENAMSGLVGSPLNGQWKIRIIDNIGGDNGYIFSWSINFDPSILPANHSFTPSIVSESWDPDPSIISMSGNDIEVQPATSGIHCYTYRVVDDFGCEYTEEVCVEVIRELLIETPPEDIYMCDVGSDNIENFDFAANANLVIGNQPPSEIEVSFHHTEDGAKDNKNVLPVSYTNAFITETIWVRIADKTQTCFEFISFDIHIVPIPVANKPSDFELCDDNSDGHDTNGITNFDLSTKINEVLGTQLISDFNVEFYTTEGDADAGIDGTELPVAVQNNTNPQLIFVRIENKLNKSCYDKTTFNLVVNSLPAVSAPSRYSQCDDDSNDGQALFNLTLESIKEEINPNYIAEGLTFTYFEDQTAAKIDGTPISNPENYMDTPGFAIETVWIRVATPEGCFRVVPLMLEVNPSSAALGLYRPNSIYQCDDGLNDRNGIAAFNLSNIHDHIATVVFSTIDVTVHFYESQIDAEIETNEILDITNHQNTNSIHRQDIWVRVKSDLGNNCLGLVGFPDLLIVESLPVANPVISVMQACDDPSNDGVFNFDTSSIEAEILNGQSLSDVSISYFDASGNPLVDYNGNLITSPFPNTFLTTAQTITYTVTNNSTNDPDGACFESNTLELIVYQLPIANSIAPIIACDGGAGDIDDDALYTFNLSTIERDILRGQSMNVYYTYIDEQGNLINRDPFLPDALISGTQTITVEVENPDNVSCTATTMVDLIVNPLPEFTVNTPQIVCSSDPTFTLDLEPFETYPTEVFNYEWLFTSLDKSIINQFVSNTREITVSTPGTYTITLTKTDGTECSKTRDIFVNASELATITLDDVTIVDVSDSNSVTIDRSNLGLGDYEYALEDEYSTLSDQPFFDYQDEPLLENVKAGIYKLYVRDKKGCGTVFLKVSVIGYPKFFTPNGDNFNDVWQIKGINAQFQPNSIIYIFDRYGKLVKQLNPLGIGWDGTFNGSPLNTDDYWFRVGLEDGREFKGHFTLKR